MTFSPLYATFFFSHRWIFAFTSKNHDLKEWVFDGLGGLVVYFEFGEWFCETTLFVNPCHHAQVFGNFCLTAPGTWIGNGFVYNNSHCEWVVLSFTVAQRNHVKLKFCLVSYNSAAKAKFYALQGIQSFKVEMLYAGWHLTIIVWLDCVHT